MSWCDSIRNGGVVQKKEVVGWVLCVDGSR